LAFRYPGVCLMVFIYLWSVTSSSFILLEQGRPSYVLPHLFHYTIWGTHGLFGFTGSELGRNFASGRFRWDF
jgi:hypothetical protein